MREELLRKLQKLIYKISSNCWVCGGMRESKHHVPPKSLNPAFYIIIPTCNRCHKILNNIEYTGRQKRSLRSNVRKIEKSVKNIRVKLLE